LVSNIELVNLLEVGVGGEFFPLRFPSDSPDACSQVEITGGTAINGGVGRMNVQVISRDVHPANAEQLATNIRSYLNDKADFLISENVQVVLVKPQNPVPLYIGTDKNQRHLFSMNYNFILGV
jgi:Bacteriophage minor capsid protein